jgi:hypothetical protein
MKLNYECDFKKTCISEYKFSSKTYQAQLMMVKFPLEQVIKAHNGSRCIALLFF